MKDNYDDYPDNKSDEYREYLRKEFPRPNARLATNIRLSRSSEVYLHQKWGMQKRWG